MSEIKLKSCPFCSNKDVRLQHRGRNQYGYYVICKNCGCRTPLYQYQFDSKEKRREEAIKQWNTRKPMERIIERLEKEKFSTLPTFDEDGYCNDDSWEVVDFDTAIEICKEEGEIE